MILYTIGKRIKNFVKVTVLSNFDKEKENNISGAEYLKNNSYIKDGKVCWYYDDGKIKSTCLYKNNLLEGISTHYYENGNVKARETYKNNKLDGVSLKYNEAGWIISEETYKSGTLITRVTFDKDNNRSVEKRS